ncbi:MAG: CapA family protein [Clostridia bacterium]|nr:CapA family protein [Clostridia bacterium]
MKKFLFVTLIIAMLLGCAAADIETSPPVSTIGTTAAPTTTGTTASQPTTTVAKADIPVPTKRETRISFAAVGDNLLHNTVTYSAQIEKGKFDFSPIYSIMKPIVEKYDLAFVNQEIPLGGLDFGLSGYPTFNGPAEAAKGLFDSGFNIINLASNHSLDKGLKCLLASYENIKKAGFDKIIGIFPDENKTDDFLVFEQDGVTIGMLSYTYGTNGMPLPKSNPNVVPLIKDEKIKSDIEKLRPECDVLIVSMHWGTEYTTQEIKEQTRLAELLNSLGVDVIIGHHPHVIEPMKIIGDEHKTVCFYSLGNFVSNQQKAATMLGGMASFDIVKTIEDEIEIQNAGVLPIVTHYNNKANKYDIYPLDSYTEELANVHGIRKYDSKFSLKYLNNLSDEVLGEYRLSLGDLND